MKALKLREMAKLPEMSRTRDDILEVAEGYEELASRVDRGEKSAPQGRQTRSP